MSSNYINNSLHATIKNKAVQWPLVKLKCKGLLISVLLGTKATQDLISNKTVKQLKCKVMPWAHNIRWSRVRVRLAVKLLSTWSRGWKVSIYAKVCHH